MSFRTFLAFVICLLPGVVVAKQQLVLVTASECPATEIGTLEVRKAYLGIGVELHGYPVRAFRFSGDETIVQLFFQNIVAMSEKSYERRMLSMALKYGRPRPIEFESVNELVAALRGRKCSIGYMWREDATSFSELRVLKILWHRN